MIKTILANKMIMLMTYALIAMIIASIPIFNTGLSIAVSIIALTAALIIAIRNQKRQQVTT